MSKWSETGGQEWTRDLHTANGKERNDPGASQYSHVNRRDEETGQEEVLVASDEQRSGESL